MAAKAYATALAATPLLVHPSMQPLPGAHAVGRRSRPGRLFADRPDYCSQASEPSRLDPMRQGSSISVRTSIAAARER